MSKSILQSIKPVHCENIAAGIKTIEVRKTRPKIQPPFKVYIYETKGKNSLAYINGIRNWDYSTVGVGAVIGEYVCDRITPIVYTMDGFADFIDCELSCLTPRDFINYGKGKTLYGWHISDLVIYDKPKELSEFYKACQYNIDGNCYLKEHNSCEHQKINELFGTRICDNKLTHPPQSWCYVEEA